VADYWQRTVDRTVEKWRFAEVDYSSAYNDFGGFLNAPNYLRLSSQKEDPTLRLTHRL
jgi:hypothetical protein